MKLFRIVTEFNSDRIIRIDEFSSTRNTPKYYNRGGGVNGILYEIHATSLNAALDILNQK